MVHFMFLPPRGSDARYGPGIASFPSFLGGRRSLKTKPAVHGGEEQFGLGPAGDGLALSAPQRGGIDDPDFLDVAGASLRDEQEPRLLPGHLIDRCPCLHDPFSALARTCGTARVGGGLVTGARKSTRLNSSHGRISYAVFCLK